MATTTSITTTYAGESAGKWISAALLSGSTLANDLITIMPNVKQCNKHLPHSKVRKLD